MARVRAKDNTQIAACPPLNRGKDRLIRALQNRVTNSSSIPTLCVQIEDTDRNHCEEGQDIKYAHLMCLKRAAL